MQFRLIFIQQIAGGFFDIMNMNRYKCVHRSLYRLVFVMKNMYFDKCTLMNPLALGEGPPPNTVYTTFHFNPPSPCQNIFLFIYFCVIDLLVLIITQEDVMTHFLYLLEILETLLLANSHSMKHLLNSFINLIFSI